MDLEHQAHHPEHPTASAAAPVHASHGHDEHADPGGHDKHAGHSVAMFRDKFWLSLLLTLPVIVWSRDPQTWLGYTAPTFPGSNWRLPEGFSRVGIGRSVDIQPSLDENQERGLQAGGAQQRRGRG